MCVCWNVRILNVLMSKFDSAKEAADSCFRGIGAFSWSKMLPVTSKIPVTAKPTTQKIPTLKSPPPRPRPSSMSSCNLSRWKPQEFQNNLLPTLFVQAGTSGVGEPKSQLPHQGGNGFYRIIVLSLSLSRRVEEMGTGAAYCQLLHILFPGARMFDLFNAYFWPLSLIFQLDTFRTGSDLQSEVWPQRRIGLFGKFQNNLLDICKTQYWQGSNLELWTSIDI